MTEQQLLDHILRIGNNQAAISLIIQYGNQRVNDQMELLQNEMGF